jgi:type I restriction enzyme S subunit
LIKITVDYETSERAGASGTFQVVSVVEVDEDDKETDLTYKIDQGKHYRSGKEVLKDLKKPNEDFEIE